MGEHLLSHWDLNKTDTTLMSVHHCKHELSTVIPLLATCFHSYSLQRFALFHIDFRSKLSSEKFLPPPPQSVSSLTFKEEEDKNGGRAGEGMPVSAFNVKQQWIVEAALAFLRNTVCVIRSAITVLIIPTPCCYTRSSCSSNCWSQKRMFYIKMHVFFLFQSGLF